MEIFTDGSSFVRDGKRKAGYAVVTAEQVLPQGTSAQLAGLVARTQALKLSKGQRANIYTAFKYAYLNLHAHAVIWKERQFKTVTAYYTEGSKPERKTPIQYTNAYIWNLQRW